MCAIIHAHLLPYCSKLVKISAGCTPPPPPAFQFHTPEQTQRYTEVIKGFESTCQAPALN